MCLPYLFVSSDKADGSQSAALPLPRDDLEFIVTAGTANISRRSASIARRQALTNKIK